MTEHPHWYPAVDPAGSTARVEAEFRRRHGRPPDGVWTAPGRVNLVGEHVDYQDGLCLPIALQQRTFAAVGRRDDQLLSVWSAQQDTGWEAQLSAIAPGCVDGWASYVAGVPWALRAQGAQLPGFDIVIDSEVPVGAGLSSSAAVESAVAVAIADLAGLDGADPTDRQGRMALARACISAENEIAGAPTGGMDQMIALAAEQGHAMMLDCRSFEFRHVRLDLAAAGLVLLVIDTRARHALVEGSYGDRRKTCQEAATLLNVSSLRDIEPGELARVYAELEDQEMQRRVRHVVTEIERVRESVVALEAGRLADLGPLLDASHESLREDYEVSWPEADLACNAARAAGALGARMTGGGFGGTVIALVTQAEMDEVALAVDAAFRAARHELPAFLLATPGGAAARADSA